MNATIVLAFLVGLLAVAAWRDVMVRRIPNAVVLGGALFGLAVNGLLSPGAGFHSVVLPGGIGWLASLQGMGLGLLLLLPLYWMRAMGAGDVKLMAMVGAFVGPVGVVGVTLMTFIAGGAMALLVALRTHMLGRLLQNVRLMLLGGVLKLSTGRMPEMEAAASIGKLPYAVAIAAGTICWLTWQRVVAM